MNAGFAVVALFSIAAHAGTTDYGNYDHPRVCRSGNATLTVSGNKTTVKVEGPYRVQTITIHLDKMKPYTVRRDTEVIIGPWHHLYIASAVTRGKGSMLDEAVFERGCEAPR